MVAQAGARYHVSIQCCLRESPATGRTSPPNTVLQGLTILGTAGIRAHVDEAAQVAAQGRQPLVVALVAKLDGEVGTGLRRNQS
jgi:hypothetical protein